MPTITYQRIWCKVCEDWTLHVKPFAKDAHWGCKICKTEYTDITYAEIPADKLAEQRTRFTKAKKNKRHDFINGGMLRILSDFGGAVDSFSEVREEIIECDAGQEAIDKEDERKRVVKYYEDRRKEQLRREEVAKYSVLGRNDVCLCGSGKKYKKCCLWKYS